MTLISSKDLFFIDDELWRLCICDAYNAIIISGLYEFIKENEIDSFMCFKHSNTDIMNKFSRMSVLADIKGLHSGASYGCTMRTVEYIIKKGFMDWKYEYIQKHCDKIVKQVKLIQRQFRKVISNPNYLLCRNRLQNEYFDLII